MAKITVRQKASPIRRAKDQRATLVGLGLNRVGRVATLEDTPSVRGMSLLAENPSPTEEEVRGMIRKVQHMVEVVKG